MVVVVASRIYHTFSLSKFYSSPSYLVCFTKSHNTNASTTYLSCGLCNVSTSVQCCYIPAWNALDVFGCTISIKIVFSALVLMRHDLSVEKTTWKPLRARFWSVCCFCQRLFFKWEGYQHSAQTLKGRAIFSVEVSFPRRLQCQCYWAPSATRGPTNGVKYLAFQILPHRPFLV